MLRRGPSAQAPDCRLKAACNKELKAAALLTSDRLPLLVSWRFGTHLHEQMNLPGTPRNTTRPVLIVKVSQGAL